jgi:TRAP-type mannitol/chloroaromatic compound transport system permease small subunit
MRAALALASGLDRLCRWSARLAAVALVLLVGVIVADIVVRRFLATPSFLIGDLEWHLHGAAAILGIGYAYTRNAHVRVEVLAGDWSRRSRLWIELVGIILFAIPFLLLLVWVGYDFAERAYVRGEGAPGGQGIGQRWIVKSLVPLSALLALAGAVAVALRAVVALRRPDLRQDAFEEAGLWTR